MNISSDTVDYLQSIEDRVTDYVTSKREAINFVFEKRILDEAIISNLIIGSLIWTADKRNETISDEDILLFLGADTELDMDSNDLIFVAPEKGISNTPLDMFLHYIATNHKD